MSNSEQVAHQKMLRDCESASHGGDVQDDDKQWIDVKTYPPEFSRMVWAACPNVITCANQTFLLYIDSDGQWRDNSGVFFGRTVNFWQYADVPECNISC